MSELGALDLFFLSLFLGCGALLGVAMLATLFRPWGDDE